MGGITAIDFVRKSNGNYIFLGMPSLRLGMSHGDFNPDVGCWGQTQSPHDFELPNSHTRWPISIVQYGHHEFAKYTPFLFLA